MGSIHKVMGATWNDLFAPDITTLLACGGWGGVYVGDVVKHPHPLPANRQRPRIPRFWEGGKQTYHFPLILFNKYTPQPTGETLQTFRYVKHERAPLGASFWRGRKTFFRREVLVLSTRIYAKRGSYWTRGIFKKWTLRGFILVQVLLLANVLKTTSPTPPHPQPKQLFSSRSFLHWFLYTRIM